MNEVYGYFRIGYSGNIETLLCPDHIEYMLNQPYTVKTKHGLDIAMYLGKSKFPCSLPMNKKYSELSFYEDVIFVEHSSSIQEFQQFEEKKVVAQQYLYKTKSKIQEMQIPMSVVDAYIFFTGEKVIFSFVSDEKKIDFRSLARELGQIFKIKIELHKIYNRDFANLLDELGPCGRRYCCSSCKLHRKKILPSSNDTVVSSNQIGSCGKPKCCLNFEN